jgi:hypothetical protein
VCKVRIHFAARTYLEIFPGVLVGLNNKIFEGAQQIQLRVQGIQNGDLGAIAPYQGLHSTC